MTMTRIPANPFRAELAEPAVDGGAPSAARSAASAIASTRIPTGAHRARASTERCCPRGIPTPSITSAASSPCPLTTSVRSGTP